MNPWRIHTMVNGMISVNDQQSRKTNLAYWRQEKKVTHRKNDDLRSWFKPPFWSNDMTNSITSNIRSMRDEMFLSRVWLAQTWDMSKYFLLSKVSSSVNYLLVKSLEKSVHAQSWWAVIEIFHLKQFPDIPLIIPINMAIQTCVRIVASKL